jgi:geranylgeranyl diphosphate synthase type I
MTILGTLAVDPVSRAHDPVRVQDVVRARVDAVLQEFLTGKADAAAARRLPDECTAALRGFLRAGGKRLRPVVCVAGWHAAGGRGVPLPVLRTAAALEMFHAFCLIHDDIMDRSITRRGRPTLHCALAGAHAAGRTTEAADHLGVSAAILIGDLALAWSDELVHTAGLTAGQLAAALPIIDAMRTEVMYGQYLDVTTAGRLSDDLDRALAIIRHKTAAYTVERPLHIGAALAEVCPARHAAVHAALTRYALPIGEAFQLRDDLLGVYGDPETTGKPRLDDLREGKHTALVALALRNATPAQRATLQALIGNPDLDHGGYQTILRIFEATGSREAVENMIRERRRQAHQALTYAPFEPAALAALHALAQTATERTR